MSIRGCYVKYIHTYTRALTHEFVGPMKSKEYDGLCGAYECYLKYTHTHARTYVWVLPEFVGPMCR